MSEKVNVAVFDFDETIVLENSLGHLFRHATGNPFYVFKAWPAIYRFVMKPGSYYHLRKCIKRRMYHACLSNVDVEKLTTAGVFAAKRMTVNPEVVSRVIIHIQKGDYVLIATASPYQYVQSILEDLKIPFNKVIGTKLCEQPKLGSASNLKTLTGSMSGEECSRKEKWTRIESCLSAEGINASKITAYGNDPDDIYMLQQADTGYVVADRVITAYQKKI